MDTLISSPDHIHSIHVSGGIDHQPDNLGPPPQAQVWTVEDTKLRLIKPKVQQDTTAMNMKQEKGCGF